VTQEISFYGLVFYCYNLIVYVLVGICQLLGWRSRLQKLMRFRLHCEL